jgi:hypothetical protein
MFLRRFDFHYFIKESGLVSHDANGGPKTAVIALV